MGEARYGWLVSYPKSGNTWMRMMLASLLAGGAPVDINQTGEEIGVSTYAEMDEFLGVESSELTEAEIARARPALHAAMLGYAEGPLVLRKVHDRFWRTERGEAVFDGGLTRAAVYILRDPRDVAVSYAHHRGVPLDRVIEVMADPEEALAQSRSGQRKQLSQPVGDWSGHVRSWVEQTEIPVLTLRYEDLRQDPAGGLRAAADFLGIPAGEGAVAAAVAATQFDLLRAQEQANGFRERHSRSTDLFFRKGVAGDWKTALSGEQRAEIEARHGEVMGRFGYL